MRRLETASVKKGFKIMGHSEIYGEQSDTGAVFSQNNSVSE
jgi:hypothetical protein